MRSRPSVAHLPATITAPVVKSAAAFSMVNASHAFSPSADCAAGTPLVLMMRNGSPNAVNFTSVTDSVGNHWTVDYAAANWAVASCLPAATIHTTDTITINTDNAGDSIEPNWWLLQIPGIQVGAIDKSATASGSIGSPSLVSTGSTATLAQANEIALVQWHNDVCNSTPGSGFTATTPGNISNIDFCQYEILASMTAIAGTATPDRGVSWKGLVVTYKGSVT